MTKQCKGMTIEEKRHYKNVHIWLKRKYGSADHCEFCNKDSNRYEWALKDGCEYEKNKDNFIQLCKLCHVNYDNISEKISQTLMGNIPWNKGEKTGPSGRKGMKFPEEWKDNIRKGKEGTTLSIEHRNNIRLGLLGKKRGPYKKSK
jgi:hypothetical protein